MKNQNCLELVPFDAIYSELAPFVNLILDPNYQANKIATLSPLDKQALLQKAKNNFEDVFFILQEKELFKKFSQNDLITIFHAHPILIQEIVKTDEVNKYLEKKDLMAISHPDKSIKANLASSDISNEAKVDHQDNENFNQFCDVFAQHLQKIETSAIVSRLLENEKLSSEEVTKISKLKHIQAVILGLSNENLAKLDFLKYVQNIIYTRKIRENALPLLEKCVSQTEESKELYARIAIAALIPHVIDYVHKTSPKKEAFVFSEETVKWLIQSTLTPKNVEIRMTNVGITFRISLALFDEKPIPSKILPQDETEDLAWYVKMLKEALNSPLANPTPQAFLAKIKAIKSPQQKGLHRYYSNGDTENYKKIMGKGHLDPLSPPDANGNTALHFAALFQPSVIERLLEQGANVNSANCHGVTPFHLIAKTGDEKLINLFLDRGARLLDKDHNQITPYDLLAKRELSTGLMDYIRLCVNMESPSCHIPMFYVYRDEACESLKYEDLIIHNPLNRIRGVRVR